MLGTSTSEHLNSKQLVTTVHRQLLLVVWVASTTMANGIFGEQAHFSTTQQSFSTSSDIEKRTCSVSKNVY